MSQDMSPGIVYNSNKGKQLNDSLNKRVSIFTRTLYAVVKALRWVRVPMWKCLQEVALSERGSCRMINVLSGLFRKMIA